MKKLTAIILAFATIISLALPIFADDEELITTEFTVVGSIYHEDSGYYEMAISYRNWIFSVSDNESRWYYTTSNVAFDLEKTRLALSSDGSEKGDAALNAVYDHEIIPFGTVVEVTWSGMIAETYPPQLEGIVSFRFTDKQTDYTLEDIAKQAKEMNEMRSGHFYTLPEGIMQDENLSDEVSSSSSGDYPAMIMVGETLYQLQYEIVAKVDDSAIIGYTSSYTNGEPSKDGETNFIGEGAPYAKVTDGIAVFYENEWHLFVPYGEYDPERAVIALYEIYDNPKTGIYPAFAWVALFGILAWCAAAMTVSKKTQ